MRQIKIRLVKYQLNLAADPGFEPGYQDSELITMKWCLAKFIMHNILNKSHAKKIIMLSLDANKKNILLSKKLETDILLRFAGITQISQAISNVGSKKNQNFVIIAIGKKSDFNLLFNEINNNLTKKPLKDSSIFLKKYFRINQKQLESVDSLTPLEDLIVEKSSILV